MSQKVNSRESSNIEEADAKKIVSSIERCANSKFLPVRYTIAYDILVCFTLFNYSVTIRPLGVV